MPIKKILIVVLTICFLVAKAKTNNNLSTYFSKIVFKIDTSEYVYPNDTLLQDNERFLYFEYTDNQSVAQIELFPSSFGQDNIKQVSIKPSGDYEVIDTLLFWNEKCYRYKVRFQNISLSEFLKFTYTLKLKNDSTTMVDLNLFPCTFTQLNINPSGADLFIGEEKAFEVTTTNLHNIKVDGVWKSLPRFDYRLTTEYDDIKLYLVPKSLGSLHVNIPVRTRKPYLASGKKLVYNHPAILQSFQVKESRLQFLNTNKKELTLNQHNRKTGIEVQIDNSRLLKLNKTYRIENQEEPGGALIAELFTKNNLANNKVLCLIRVYNLHQKSQGYLYIKDGDKPKFITNFSVTPETTIDKISILKKGKDWSDKLQVHPGEEIEIKLEGKGLHKADFDFEDVINITEDTLLHTSDICTYKLSVPINFGKKQISILNHNRPTGHNISVKEYKRPRNLDFVFINYGGGRKRVSGIRGPLFYDQTIKNVAISFYTDLIDSKEELYGKQHLRFKIRLTDKKGDLIEMRTIDNIVVCPGKLSPRHEFYDKGNCHTTDVNLNNYISRKTYDLNEWAKIEIVVEHQKDQYGANVESKKVEIYLQRHFKFDIDVSFPAGLLVNKEGESGYGSFGGISMAMIAQFSFYHPDKINQYRPYKIGAGFLAFNAFNFEATSNRDVGAVILGSIYPTSKDSRLSFPLYLGGGYFLEEGKWFYLIGPGIRVKI
jgi:hypothetical protein